MAKRLKKDLKFFFKFHFQPSDESVVHDEGALSNKKAKNDDLEIPLTLLFFLTQQNPFDL